MWHALSVLYDQCVGNCDCIPDRDIPDKSITVHFSCIQVSVAVTADVLLLIRCDDVRRRCRSVSLQGVNKPGGYATEKEFGDDMFTKAPSCTRNWFWNIWCVPLANVPTSSPVCCRIRRSQL